jgi:hypothetical protein
VQAHSRRRSYETSFGSGSADALTTTLRSASGVASLTTSTFERSHIGRVLNAEQAVSDRAPRAEEASRTRSRRL